LPKSHSSDTKLALVRAAMEAGDWESAIQIAGQFHRLGEHADAIRSARDALNNRVFYQQMGKDVDALIEAAIEALKERYSASWISVQTPDPDEKKENGDA
jgi:hypothetical protein